MCLIDKCCFLSFSGLLAREKFYMYLIGVFIFSFLAREKFYMYLIYICLFSFILWAAG